MRLRVILTSARVDDGRLPASRRRPYPLPDEEFTIPGVMSVSLSFETDGEQPVPFEELGRWVEQHLGNDPQPRLLLTIADEPGEHSYELPDSSVTPPCAICGGELFSHL